jgi:uncharacterized membrane protein
LAAILVPLFIATLGGAYLLWPGTDRVPTPRDLAGPDGRPVTLVDATVLSSRRGPCDANLPPGTELPADTGGEAAIACIDVAVRLTSGPDAGSARMIQESFDPKRPVFKAGDRVRVGRTTATAGGDGTPQYYEVADYERSRPLTVLALVFAAVVVAVARWRGLAALAGMGLTFLILVFFLFPALLQGSSPIAVSLVTSSGVLFVLLYLAHGPSARTSTALVGTLLSLGLTGALGYLAIELTRLTGLGSEDMATLTAFTELDLTGLILASLVIGSLGLLNDVTVTQASAVWELSDAAPGAGVGTLYKAGMRIGRDHIASAIYTIMLAYTGAALPLLLLLALADRSAYDVITGDLLAAEVVRTAVGSIGLVASVPITTGIAALIASRRPRTQSHTVPADYDEADYDEVDDEEEVYEDYEDYEEEPERLRHSE